MTSTLLTLALLLPGAPAPAPKNTLPKGPAPRVVLVSVKSDGTPCIERIVTRMVPQQIPRAVRVGQAIQTVVETVPVAVQQTVQVSLDGEGVEVYGADGKKIDPKEVRKLVRRSVPALASVDGKPVDPFYLRLAREGTLILVFRPTDPNAPNLPRRVRILPRKP